MPWVNEHGYEKLVKDVILSYISPLVGKALSTAIAHPVSAGHVETLSSSLYWLLTRERFPWGIREIIIRAQCDLACFCFQYWGKALFEKTMSTLGCSVWWRLTMSDGGSAPWLSSEFHTKYTRIRIPRPSRILISTGLRHRSLYFESFPDDPNDYKDLGTIGLWHNRKCLLHIEYLYFLVPGPPFSSLIFFSYCLT